MPASLRAACLIILSVFAWLWAAQDAHADVSCSVSQSEVVYYLDAEQEACRTGGEHPAHGAMVRAELGGDYVAMDVSYAAGAGPQEPTDLQCLEGVCGVGPYDGEGGYQVGDVLACEGNCRTSTATRRPCFLSMTSLPRSWSRRFQGPADRRRMGCSR